MVWFKKIPPVLSVSKKTSSALFNRKQQDFSRLTSCVDVKVGGLVGHVPYGVQTRPPGVHLAGVTHIFGDVDCVGTLVDVLTSKEHFHLRRKREDSIVKGRPWMKHLDRSFNYLVNTFNFWNISDCVGSTFIFVGFDFCLEHKTGAVRLKRRC